MEYSLVIKWMIAICAVFIGLMVFSRPIKYILRFLVQATCGMLMVFVLNILLSPLNLSLGLNYLNFFLAGLLGAPGVVSLYVMAWLIR